MHYSSSSSRLVGGSNCIHDNEIIYIKKKLNKNNHKIQKSLRQYHGRNIKN